MGVVPVSMIDKKGPRASGMLLTLILVLPIIQNVLLIATG